MIPEANQSVALGSGACGQMISEKGAGLAVRGYLKPISQLLWGVGLAVRC